MESQIVFDHRDRSVAEAVRKACMEAALAAYEEASMQGLCHEGAWEVAVGALKTLDVDAVLKQERDRLATRREEPR